MCKQNKIYLLRNGHVSENNKTKTDFTISTKSKKKKIEKLNNFFKDSMKSIRNGTGKFRFLVSFLLRFYN